MYARHSDRRRMLVGLLLAIAAAAGAMGQTRSAKVPVLLDTDIGDASDDAFALALLLASPELELRGVTTVGDDAHTKAGIVCQFLENIVRRDVPVAAGSPRRAQPLADGQHQYGLRARQTNPMNRSAVEFLGEMIAQSPGELTIVAIGPLTNIAALLKARPDSARQIKRLVIMGGALRVGYNGRPPAEPEWNMRTDVAAAREVLASGATILMTPLDATAELRLDGQRLTALLTSRAALARQVQALEELQQRSETPVLFDPAAVALEFDERLFSLEAVRLAVDDNGLTRAIDGPANVRIATSVKREALLDLLVHRLTHVPGEGSGFLQERPPPVIVTPLERGGMPARVHVCEDYETDIERRWWLAGKLEVANVPPGSRRACRGVLCRDFDDKQGLRGATYRAVIFNPVPGPPMGPATRLGFRYWLRGTDRLRVQIYSLTNGYHRQLVLDGLPQGQWREATVDMTAARRPDGSGGALAADERIDDIQFYAAPEAELRIDDIALYDAAPVSSAPFPERFVFTGGFDTGRQGVEWPGDFEIVPHEPPLKWKAAQAVETPDKDGRWIRLDLRGPRPVGDRLAVRFRYRLSGASAIQLQLAAPNDARRADLTLDHLRPEEWSAATVDGPPLKHAPAAIDQLIFRVPHHARLQVDDVLIYTPAGK